MRLIGEQRIALKYPFEGTTVGGLSGIDYDAANNSWVMESDDRSAINPARFYRATLAYDSKAFTGVTLASVHFFTQPDGSRYPNLAHAKLEQGDQVPDIETIRVDPQDGSLWYGSEGNRKVGLDPFVRHADSGGHYLATLPTPAMFKVAKDEIGSRNNMSFEALSFSSDGKSLWLGMEAALYQDAPLATPDIGSVVRITRLDRAGSVLGQYAYPIEPVASRPAPGKEADNGVSEILAVNDHRCWWWSGPAWNTPTASTRITCASTRWKRRAPPISRPFRRWRAPAMCRRASDCCWTWKRPALKESTISKASAGGRVWKTAAAAW